MSLLDTASLVITPNGTKASKLYSVVPSDGAGDMTVTRATTATRVNSAGLVESVASNVPRLDYSNGTCPSILVEPQRTNLFNYSEQFENAYWGKYQTSLTANSIVAPDGNTTADTATVTTGTGGSVYLLSTLTGTYTVSIFMKAGTSSATEIEIPTIGNAIFNLSAGTFTTSGSVTGTIKSFGSGWYRCTATFTGTSVPYIAFGITGTTGQTINLWGAQLEAGSYATSYIPTTSASVTRNADQIYKSSISSLIGQTEGTIFIDFYHDGLSTYFPCSISNGLYSDAIYFEQYLGNMQFVIFDNGNFQIAFNAGALSIGRHKMAVGYKTNDTVFYIDGVLKYTDTSLTVPDCSRFDIGFVGGVSIDKTVVNSTALWKTRLTNTQLAQLTTI